MFNLLRSGIFVVSHLFEPSFEIFAVLYHRDATASHYLCIYFSIYLRCAGHGNVARRRLHHADIVRREAVSYIRITAISEDLRYRSEEVDDKYLHVGEVGCRRAFGKEQMFSSKARDNVVEQVIADIARHDEASLRVVVVNGKAHLVDTSRFA